MVPTRGEDCVYNKQVEAYILDSTHIIFLSICICIFRRGLRQLAAKGWIIVGFTVVLLVIGPIYSSTNSTPSGVYRPAAITALVTI